MGSNCYEQAALMLTETFGYWGFILFAASLGIACFGAALEVTLDTAYIVAQALGWNWGENLRPREAARFSLVYTVFVFLEQMDLTDLQKPRLCCHKEELEHFNQSDS